MPKHIAGRMNQRLLARRGSTRLGGIDGMRQTDADNRDIGLVP